MKTRFYSFTLIFIGLLTAFFIFSTCCTISAKQAPEYKGVDPKVQNLVNEYKALAKINGITFKNEVTIGFKHIEGGSVVGLTSYGVNWREIDLDSEYWNKTTQTTRLTLLFHELAHAYCDRKHDFSNGTLYKEANEISKSVKEGTLDRSLGYFSDYCPLSMMFPIIVSDSCALSHYHEYTTELFNRCIPY